MDHNIPLLTIITPTYNREELLKNCYFSLMAQTCKDFEWIIVDDGSRDNTETAAKEFNADQFPITYIKKENGGKHTALNASHPHIRGKYVLILDSDDVLTESAVADILASWSIYEDQDEIGVITFLKSTPDGAIFCSVKDFDKPVDILTYPRKIYLGNDCCEVIRTELFKRYPFPVFAGERFLSEGVLWNRVAQTHKCVYINKAIYLCEYLPGGLTQAGRTMRIRNPQGGMLAASFGMLRQNSIRCRVKSGLLYTCYGFFAGCGVLKILLKDPGNLGIKLVCLVPGYLLYCFWKHKYLK